MWPSPKVPDSIALKASASCGSALAPGSTDSTYLGGSLGKGSGLVRVVPSDLVNLVGEISKQEALHDEFRVSRFRSLKLTFSSPASSAISVEVSDIRDEGGMTYRHWLHRLYQAKEHHQGQASYYSTPSATACPYDMTYSTRSFSSSSRDLNTQISSRDQDLRNGDTVIWNESDPQQISYVGIVVDDFANVYNQSDDQFSDIVPRGSFTGKDISPWLHLLPLFRGCLFNSKVPVNDGEDVESLSFILVKSLDLACKDGIDVDRDTKFGFEDIGKSSLVVLLDGSESFSELGIVSHGQQVGE